MAAHGHDLPAAEIAGDAADRLHIDQRAAVDLPEHGRVQLIDQLFDGLADQRLHGGRLHPGVLLVADEKQHLGHRNHLDALAHAGLDPVQVSGRGTRVELACQLVQQLLQRRGGAGRVAGVMAGAVTVASISGRRLAQCQALLDALGGALQPLTLGRLQHVITHALLKRLDRVLVIRGDEDDLGQVLVVANVHLGDLARRVHPGQAGHADVEKHQLGPVLVDQVHRFQPVAGFGHDLQRWPDLSQPGAQLLPHQPLIVGDDGAHGAGAGAGAGVSAHGRIVARQRVGGGVGGGVRGGVWPASTGSRRALHRLVGHCQRHTGAAAGVLGDGQAGFRAMQQLQPLTDVGQAHAGAGCLAG